MAGSQTSVIGEADDFQAALSAEGVVGLLLAGPGQFRARLTQVILNRFRLTAGEEALPRIAFVAVPAGRTLISLPVVATARSIWVGVEMSAGEIVTVPPGERVHIRTAAPCRWGAIQAPEQDLALYGHALSGPGFAMPHGIARWRPRRAGLRALHRLHQNAIRKAEARSGAFADAAAAHGLEQQLLHALINCLAAGPAAEETPAERRHRNLMAGFEDLLRQGSLRRTGDICAALGVSDRLFRECCRAQLGMSGTAYRRLHAVQQVHRALRGGSPETGSVAAAAARYGFRDPGRFAANYRAIYGELPSATLRRGRSRGIAELILGRPRITFP